MTQPSLPVELLTQNEALRVVEAFSRRYATGVRNRAMLAIMWRSGLRSAEACGLHLKDVDMDSSIIHIRHGKGDVSRRVGIDAWGRQALDLWLLKRGNMRRVKSNKFFCTHNDGAVSGQYLRLAFRRAGERAGIDKRVHPHVFRHMFAVELSQGGRSLPLISQALGHKDVVITAEYLRHLNPQAVIEATRGY